MKRAAKTLGLAVIASVLMSLVASSEARSAQLTSNTQLLNYQQLIRLSSAKREAYLRGVRAMLVEIAKVSEKNKDKRIALQLREMRNQVSVLEQLLFGSAASADEVHENIYPKLEGSATGASKTWTCNEKLGVRFDARVGTCVDRGNGRASRCETGFYLATVNMGDDVFLKYCVPKASWQRLSQERRNGLAGPEGAPDLSEEMKSKGHEAMKGIVLGGAPADSRTSTQSLEALVAPGAEETVSSAGAIAAAKCEYKAVDCSVININDARKAYFADATADRCVFAGVISTFIDGVKGRGRCQSVRDFSFGSSAALTCKSWKKTICNPLVFGVQNNGEPFCVDAKGAATRQCQADSTEGNRKPDFLNSDIPGIQEKWDEFSKEFNKLCFDDSSSKAYFCEECNIMSQRLFAMNAVATGDACGRAVDGPTLKSKPAGRTD